MISIIVPAYNVEKYLARCLDSIIRQTYKNIEIIVVNDGSTDETGRVLDEYVKKYPKIIKPIYIENGGVTNARLTGVSVAKGTWIGFVDGDDEIENNMYEFLVKNAIKHHAEISHCGYQMVFSDGRIHYFYNSGCLVVQDRITALKELLLGLKIEPGLCNKLFHKNLFYNILQTDLMNRSIKINEDLLMNYYLFNSANNTVYEDLCPYHYIVRPNSASRQKLNENKIFDPIRVKKIIFKQCDESLKIVAESALLNTCVYSYCGLTALEGKSYGKAKKEIRKELMNHISCVDYLPKRTRILAQGIYKIPWLIDIAYPIYTKYFQKRVYE